MSELKHVLERKEFVCSGELNLKYEESEVASQMGKNSQIHNILGREDFVNDEEYKNKFSITEITFPKLESPQEVKLLDKDEKLLGFDEFVNKFYKN